MDPRAPLYSLDQLLALRERAFLPLSKPIASAQSLNLWQPTAELDGKGKSQPFPFHLFPKGVTGKITSYQLDLSQVFSMSSTSANSSADAQSWDDHHSTTGHHSSADNHSIRDSHSTTGHQSPAEHDSFTEQQVPAEQKQGDIVADAQKAKSPISSPAGGMKDEERKALSEMLAKGFGPHRLFSANKQTAQPISEAGSVGSTAPTKNDKVVSAKDSDSVSAKDVEIVSVKGDESESTRDDGRFSDASTTTKDAGTQLNQSPSPSFDRATQTLPDTLTSRLFDASPVNSAPLDESQKHILPPHRKYQATAPITPLPDSPLLSTNVILQSSFDELEGNSGSGHLVDESKPVFDDFDKSKSGFDDSKSVSNDIDKSALITINEDDESDGDQSVIIITNDISPSHATVLDDSLDSVDTLAADRALDALDPRASAWLPPLVNHDVDGDASLPPSRPLSPTKSDADDTLERHLINSCCPVPAEWKMVTISGEFASGHLFSEPFLCGVPKAVLAYYSHFFATRLDTDKDDSGDMDAVLNDACFSVFRNWIFGRRIYINSKQGVDLGLDDLVKLYRYGARIQAPLFVNAISDLIMAKNFTANDVLCAAAEIDGLLQLVHPTHAFRTVISHAIIVKRIPLDFNHYNRWPKSLIFCVLSSLEMAKWSATATDMYTQCHRCAVHLHPRGSNCAR